MRIAGAFFLVCIFQFCCGLNNGLGIVPQMGYNSWYDVYMSPTESKLKQVVATLQNTGLFALGYRYVNLDDGMIEKRGADGRLLPDPKLFPSGFASIAKSIHEKGMLFGIYTDRGQYTCGGRPGALGHEVLDAYTYASWGVDYVKEDSCYGSQNHSTAFSDYARMRDALNATGRRMFFSLCGWNDWYSPVGSAIGNSWRIGPDDTNWEGILTNIDINSALARFAGPGGWNDPCLLLGYDENGTPAINEKQGRSQFTMWAIMASPLLLSQNLQIFSSYQLETYSNVDVIAVNQDRLGKQGRRILGGELSPPNPSYSALTLQRCSSKSPHRWKITSNQFLVNIDTGMCANVDDCGTRLISYPCVTSGGTCAGPDSYANEQFIFSRGFLMSNLSVNLCVASFGEQYGVSLQICNEESNQKWSFDAESGQIRSKTGLCLTVGGNVLPRANIWARPLIDGSWAFSFVNADAMNVTLNCNSTCMMLTTGWEEDQALKVKDLWNKKEWKTTVKSGIAVQSLEPDGAMIFRVTPLFSGKQARG